MWQRDLPGVSGLDSSNIGLGFCLFFFELLSRDVGDGCTPRRAVRLVCTCPHRDFSVVLGGVWLQPVATRLACCCSTSWMALLGGHWTCVSCAEHILVNAKQGRVICGLLWAARQPKTATMKQIDETKFLQLLSDHTR